MKSNFPIRPLKGYDCFGKVFNYGKKFYLENVILVIVTKDSELIIKKSSEKDIFYIGVGTSKKLNKKAVIRNRIKRLLRVSIRELYFENQLDINNYKYGVILYNKKIEHPKLIRLKDIKPLVNEVFNKAKNYYSNIIEY